MSSDEKDPRDDGCLCGRCDRRYKVDLMIPDELWEKIKLKGAWPNAGLLCGRCIVEKLEDLGFAAFELKPL